MECRCLLLVCPPKVRHFLQHLSVRVDKVVENLRTNDQSAWMDRAHVSLATDMANDDKREPARNNATQEEATNHITQELMITMHPLC